MTIHCNDIEQLIEIVSGLAVRNIMFEADAGKLLIKLTGGC